MIGKKSWAIRRRIVWTGVVTGILMLIAGTVAVFTDKNNSADLITGGVALVSLCLTSYIGGAAYEDVRLHSARGENSDG